MSLYSPSYHSTFALTRKGSMHPNAFAGAWAALGVVGLACVALLLSPWRAYVTSSVAGSTRPTPGRQLVHLAFWLLLAMSGFIVGAPGADLRGTGALLAGATGGPVAGLAVAALSSAPLFARAGTTALVSGVFSATLGLVGGVAGRGLVVDARRGRRRLLLPPVLSAAAAAASLVAVDLHAGTHLTLVAASVAIGAAAISAGVAALTLRRIDDGHGQPPDGDPAPARQSYLDPDAVKDSFIRTLDLLGTVVDARDEYTARHSVNVARCAVAIGRSLRLEEPQLASLWVAGLTHDVGKIAIPDSVLSKAEDLDETERKVIRAHVAEGARILQAHGGVLADMARFAELHHEKYGGQGYPHGTTQTDLSIGILTVADALEAMTSHRPYRPALTVTEVIAQLRGGSGSEFHPEAVAAAIGLIETAGCPHRWNVARPDLGQLPGLGGARGAAGSGREGV